ncbi:MAG: hypothetical protein BWX50_01300 [Euryarchaeota archaeon ADurb.Bin009]|nr:MAG: hypothetical protein BWX50_01300 [Euryarchaeota archaeon ADurb.Bin009]
MASVSVTTAGRPSGITATASETPMRNISRNSRCCRKPTPIASTAIPTAMIPMSRPRTSICRARGVASALTRWERPAIRPNSVLIPVATATPRPHPLTTVVPAKTMLLRSASGVSGVSGPVALSTGEDSPVSGASST